MFCGLGFVIVVSIVDWNKIIIIISKFKNEQQKNNIANLYLQCSPTNNNNNFTTTPKITTRIYRSLCLRWRWCRRWRWRLIRRRRRRRRWRWRLCRARSRRASRTANEPCAAVYDDIVYSIWQYRNKILFFLEEATQRIFEKSEWKFIGIQITLNLSSRHDFW